MNFDLVCYLHWIWIKQEIGIELHDPDFCNTTAMLMRSSLDKCAIDSFNERLINELVDYVEPILK